MRQVRSPNPRVGASSDSPGAAEAAVSAGVADPADSGGATDPGDRGESRHSARAAADPRRGPLRRRKPTRAQKPPTVRQVYALAAALCAFTDQDFPRTREEASDLIERLRIDIGHPEPSLPDPPPFGRRR
jgi:hypothetical protein